MTLQFRKILSLIGLVVLTNCSVVKDVLIKPTPQLLPGTILFADDFSTTENGWKTWNQDNSYVMFQAGGLHFFNNQPNYDFWSKPGYKFSDVKIQADAIKIGGPDNNSFGVICRMTDDLNFYAFIISSDGYSGILKVFEGKYELLNGDSMEFSSAIIKGDSLNQITAECFSNDLSLAVNGKNVLKAQDSDFTSGDVGFIVGTFDEAGVEVLFDNLSVIQP
jgi:hypothetical protein